jgi:hypothetical protein
MTPKKVLTVLDRYEMAIGLHVASSVSADSEVEQEQLKHLLTMIPQMKIFIQAEQMDKVFRWLGFMQGVLWSTSMYTLDELKQHNREESLPPHVAT